MLFFIPFQRNIANFVKAWSAELAIHVNRSDDITLVMLFPLALLEIYRNRENINRNLILLFFPLMILSISGLISGFVNGNALYITILGIFDYVKIFLFIFVYAAFFRGFRNFEKIFRSLLIVAVVLGTIAFIQELWALSYRYILGKNIYDPGMYIFRILPAVTDPVISSWRLGIYRVPSLVGHYNLLGLYSLLFMTIYMHTVKKVNLLVGFFLLIGILVSMSRVIYMGFTLLLVWQILRGRKWFIYLIIPVVVTLFFMSTLWDLNIWESTSLSDTTELEEVLKDRESPDLKNAISYRKYTKHKAMEIWRDYPVWGVGPGMFGGPVSVFHNSHIYNEYNFQKSSFFKVVLGLDHVWPQILAEMGIVGLANYIGLFVVLIMVLLVSRQRATSKSMRELFTGLAIFTIIIIIWGFGGVFKNAVIYTYCAFTGMGLSSLTNRNLTKNRMS